MHMPETIYKVGVEGESPGSHIKGEGMFASYLGGKNLGFWSHLGCSVQNAILCSSEGLL